jgi:hypothetical protein
MAARPAGTPGTPEHRWQASSARSGSGGVCHYSDEQLPAFPGSAPQILGAARYEIFPGFTRTAKLFFSLPEGHPGLVYQGEVMQTGITTGVLAGQNAPRNPNGHRTADQPNELIMASNANGESLAGFTYNDGEARPVIRYQPDPGAQNPLGTHRQGK